MKKLLGSSVYEKITNQVKIDINKLKARKIRPVLAIISFAARSDSQGYLRTREKLANELGITLKITNYKKVPTEQELKKEITNLNNNKLVHGIIIDRFS
jgi:methylenetetrahydrofolate dehydrogenase (NADP+)/methenyltetrahydrofolate cyclohydrolase